MNTQKLFKNFHRKTQEEIVELIKQFVREDFFLVHPELENEISILVTGSVASGHYDRRSDIDLVIVFPTEKRWKEMKFVLLDAFKDKYLEPRKKPLEVHGKNITYLGKITKDLGQWKIDWMLQEFADAIIIHDPKGRIGKLKQRYAWYPEDIFHEKIQWLFAESTFLLFDRYENAMERAQEYFCETIKVKILRHMLSLLSMADNCYPTYDKHAYDCVAANPSYAEFVELIDEIVVERSMKKTYKFLLKLRKKTEKMLTRKKLIPKEGEKYWISLRPKQSVLVEA